MQQMHELCDIFSQHFSSKKLKLIEAYIVNEKELKELYIFYIILSFHRFVIILLKQGLHKVIHIPINTLICSSEIHTSYNHTMWLLSLIIEGEKMMLHEIISLFLTIDYTNQIVIIQLSLKCVD